MRPALQRLLARPSSLELLRCLVGTPVSLTPASIDRVSYHRMANRCCHYASTTVPAQAVEENYSEDTRSSQVLPVTDRQDHGMKSGIGLDAAVEEQDEVPENQGSTYTVDQLAKAEHLSGGMIALVRSGQQSEVTASANIRLQIRRSGARPHLQAQYGPWNEALWTYEQLDFESNLDVQDTSKQRLLDHPVYKTDMNLWACFLSFRQRIYGLEGVSMYWRVIHSRNLEVPVHGHAATTFWTAFLTLGFQDESQLLKIWNYANWLLATTRKRWTWLYPTIVQHFLLNGQGQQAMKWHQRLHSSHPPGPKGFAEMFRQVTLWKGDIAMLRQIYEKSSLCNVYGKVVPILCRQENFKAALEWHWFLMRHKDRPRSSEIVEPLIDFLALYDNHNAVLVTKSLAEAGVPFAPRKSPPPGEHSIISREMMNLIHGKTFNVPVKKYNDSLGARWFATSWISLDVAISAVHALGVQEIGPLSLQAIALREMDSKSVVGRIKQLKKHGISIGDSVFSRAVEDFARNRRQDFLEGILQSDQHPDALEDWKLQEALLTSYAQANNWPQYRRTMAIRLIGSKSRGVDAQNIALRSHISRGDIPAIHGTLLKMQTDCIPVRARTISYLVLKTLSRRQPGRRPATVHNQFRELGATIAILKGITISGTSVGVAHWRELIRRLGMLGLLDELYPLCHFLASWYGPIRRVAFWGPLENDIPNQRLFGRRPYRKIPAAVPTSHPLHPLKVLFPPSLQKAIVEWGFIRALREKPKRVARSISLHPDGISSRKLALSGVSLLDVTSGIRHLQRLRLCGVDIDIKSVRSAIFNRLVIYYGHGTSNRPYNRVARMNNPLTFDEMVRQIDDAMGERVFPRIADLKKTVELGSRTRTRRLRIREEKHPKRFGRSGWTKTSRAIP